MKMCASRLAGLAAVAMVAFLASCSAEKLPSAYAALESSADFSVLKLAVDATGLNATLKDPKFVGTIFAPTNQAFVALLAKVGLNANAVLANKDLAAAVLKYHVLPKAYKAADFKIGATYKTLLGSRIQILSSNGSVFVNSYASKAKVLTADVEAPAAVIHVIDTVLVPKFGPYKGCRTVASLVGGSTRLKSLFAAVKAAGLDKLLSKRGFSGTVFAPTDAAFAKLLKALNTTLPELAKDKKLLTSVLLYHVITPGRVYASNIDNHTHAFTAAIRPLRFNVVKGVKVIGRGSTATVIKADIFACKAVVHLIDTVLLPFKAGGK